MTKEDFKNALLALTAKDEEIHFLFKDEEECKFYICFRADEFCGEEFILYISNYTGLVSILQPKLGSNIESEIDETWDYFEEMGWTPVDDED